MQTTLYQLELNQGIVICGMSYVIQLKDGRFLLMDGGYFSEGEEERLYRFLKERANGRIVIAGWFFSHAHQDHIGTFLNFAKRYSSQVQIDKLYYNFQPVELPTEEVDYKSSDPATVKEFYRVVDQYFSKDQIHTLKTGEFLSFGEVSLEVLYTQENLYPVQSTFNDYSSVLMMTVEGQKILWLGDVYKMGCAYLLEHKKEKLQCDIVQISHHGYGGATKELYASLNAKTALWPTPDYRLNELAKSEVNHYLLEESTIQEHIVSGQGTAALTLPYKVGTAKRFPKEFFQWGWTVG